MLNTNDAKVINYLGIPGQKVKQNFQGRRSDLKGELKSCEEKKNGVSGLPQEKFLRQTSLMYKEMVILDAIHSFSPYISS